MIPWILLAALSIGSIPSGIALFPRESTTRETKSLDGIWSFRTSPSLDPGLGFREEWFNKPLSKSGEVIDMPVPASYNDITTNASLRDFVGWAWYDRTFYVPSSWSDPQHKVKVHFGSAHFTSIVWINGKHVVEHDGGHLPFEAEISDVLKFGQENLISVAVNNTLQVDSIPQGKWMWMKESSKYPAGYFNMEYTFDFFNYAGIHRSVQLYKVPREVEIKDITVQTEVDPNLTSANVTFSIEVDMPTTDYTCHVNLFDGDNNIASVQACSSSLHVSNASLWWPYLMHDNPGHMHLLHIVVNSNKGKDDYKLPIGIRHVSWDSGHFYINHQPFYFRGFGRHEDSNIRGKGLDLALITKDYDLIKWLGANSFRTSHYPYAEEIMDFADRNGIVVIDECPGVNLEGFHDNLLHNHLKVMDELVSRDKNHPSVVMWSLGNEPRSATKAARPYFEKVSNHTRNLDPTRPQTLVVDVDYSQDEGSYAVDIISINRYFGWYTDTGHTELIERQLTNDIEHWKKKHMSKPIIVTEYGADTIAGFHEIPAFIFTEEYQSKMMLQYFKVFDLMRSKNILIGEMIWNFADFMTRQTYTRAWGNRKGILTRERHPKEAAHILRTRYWSLAETKGDSQFRPVKENIVNCEP